MQSELTRYLSDNWVPVIEKDVDGPNSLPMKLDSELPNLGKFSGSEDKSVIPWRFEPECALVRIMGSCAMRRMDDEMAQAGSPMLRSAGAGRQDSDIPAYLRETYTWAYLSRLGTTVFDRQPVVNAILWGNARRLIEAALAEVREGEAVLQPACVYGTFSRDLARAAGPRGRLVISDVAPIQLALTRRKVAGLSQVTLARCNAERPGRGPFGVVVCFFLLHEVPADCRRRIVDALLGAVRPGGKVVFVDYHRPRPWHLLRPVMSAVFSLLEPFAKDLWHSEIRDHAARPYGFVWEKETFFGGLYQKVVATRV